MVTSRMQSGREQSPEQSVALPPEDLSPRDTSSGEGGPRAGAEGEGADDPAAELAAVRLELRRISHDLKNSLHAWSLRMDLLARQLGLAETDANVRQLSRVLERVGTSIEGLRALAHGGRPPG